jgi:hypothetical protein
VWISLLGALCSFFAFRHVSPVKLGKLYLFNCLQKTYVGPIDKLRGRNCMEDL